MRGVWGWGGQSRGLSKGERLMMLRERKEEIINRAVS